MAGGAGGPETGTECVEDNECKDGTHTCPANSYCVNTDASFNCDCYDGYYFGNNQCNNINEVCYQSSCHPYLRLNDSYKILSVLKVITDAVSMQNVSIMMEVTHVNVMMDSEQRQMKHSKHGWPTDEITRAVLISTNVKIAYSMIVILKQRSGFKAILHSFLIFL